jgi:N-methylhydantoinase A
MRVAIDTGGTFTDCVFVHDGRLEIVKVLSTPKNPAEAIGHALARVLETVARPETLDLSCGTTVGTNALLERRGGRVALVTTAGFEDVLEIGRQARPRLYDFFVTRPEPLVPRSRRFGLGERVASDGRVLHSPSERELKRVVREVRRSGAESVAICLLFSYVNPEHERRMAAALRRAGWEVSASHEILPEFREYERTSTTVVNAYLVPVMSRYLGEIETQVRRRFGRGRTHVRLMQSSGGIVAARAAAREPVRTILSGPAGGVLGAQYVAGRSGFNRIVSFDMGGTSTDVALIDGGLRTTNEASVAELPVAVPMLDIHTVGAGGGSVARFDRAGALRVGPESAGADPGPICYGRGELPTVTDAHVVLGRIPAAGLLGGKFPLDVARARRYLERARGPLESAEAFAEGILSVANATMEKAIRVISVERGHDPRDYTLVAFGGAGALHACELAAALRMPRVLVPRFPGGLSALGILRADVVRDLSRTIQQDAEELRRDRRRLEAQFAEMERGGLEQMRKEGFPAERVRIERYFDIRYAGQAYELLVPAKGDFVTAFHRAHERRYGYSDVRRPVEVANLRARLVGETPPVELPRARSRGRSARGAIVSVERVVMKGTRVPTPVYARDRLQPGNRFAGPAIVTEYSATTYVPRGWQARVDAVENLILTPAGRSD